MKRREAKVCANCGTPWRHSSNGRIALPEDGKGERRCLCAFQKMAIWKAVRLEEVLAR